MGPCDAEIGQLNVVIRDAPGDGRLPVDRAVRVAVAQLRPGHVVWPWLEWFLDRFMPHILVLPEYVWYGPEYVSLSAAARAFPDLLDLLLERTRTWDCVLVAGTLVEKTSEGYRSHAYLIRRGTVIGDYVKINPTPGEARHGLRGGHHILVLQAGYLRLAPLICADIFCADLFDRMRKHAVNLVVLPTASPLKPGESVQEKYRRDRVLYQTAARRLNGYLVKVCGVGSVFGRPLQGRSLVATPHRILWRVPPQAEDQVLLAGMVLPFDTV